MVFFYMLRISKSSTLTHLTCRPMNGCLLPCSALEGRRDVLFPLRAVQRRAVTEAHGGDVLSRRGVYYPQPWNACLVVPGVSSASIHSHSDARCAASRLPAFTQVTRFGLIQMGSCLRFYFRTLRHACNIDSQGGPTIRRSGSQPISCQMAVAMRAGSGRTRRCGTWPTTGACWTWSTTWRRWPSTAPTTGSSCSTAAWARPTGPTAPASGPKRSGSSRCAPPPPPSHLLPPARLTASSLPRPCPSSDEQGRCGVHDARGRWGYTFRPQLLRPGLSCYMRRRWRFSPGRQHHCR